MLANLHSQHFFRVLYIFRFRTAWKLGCEQKTGEEKGKREKMFACKPHYFEKLVCSRMGFLIDTHGNVDWHLQIKVSSVSGKKKEEFSEEINRALDSLAEGGFRCKPASGKSLICKVLAIAKEHACGWKRFIMSQAPDKKVWLSNRNWTLVS